MPSFEYFCLILKVFCCIVELFVTPLGLQLNTFGCPFISNGIASKFSASTVSARVPCWVEMRSADTAIQTVPFAVKPRGVWHRLPCSK